ncbi:MAG: hypothetical protein ACI87E_000508 [Mariniblastus sp.]|jgi:hypothetical protein
MFRVCWEFGYNRGMNPRSWKLFRFWPALLIGAAWLWLFWPFLLGRQVTGFRDSAYLYYPLFQWIDAQWAAGQIPLWNPYCNWGMPVVADGSSSVFYPGKLIFFCRFLSYPARYGIYLAIHIPLAAGGAYWLARIFRANPAGATLAAFSFAFGGSVLFQVTNVIFLVSAAWLPFAVACVWKMIKHQSPGWAVAAGVCCAFMILGGDPQMVYHIGLIAVGTIGFEFFRRRKRRLGTACDVTDSPYVWLVGSFANLVLLVVVTSCLAAVQILPTYVWSKHSERTQPATPVNLYSAAASPDLFRTGGNDLAGSLLGPPTETADHAYQFSQPPWSLAELFWPNISGKPFPLHQRWASALPGADRIWMPSLYLGLVVVLLGLSGVRLWGRRRKQVWLSWLTVVFLLGSFGWYGCVWAYNEFATPESSSQLGPQVGGVYWMLTMVLPKYFAFRYPAKLFVIASLGISLLASTQLRMGKLKRAHWLMVGIVATTMIGTLIVRFGFEQSMHSLPADRIYGPFDSTGAIGAVYLAAMQTIVVAGLAGLVLWPNSKHNGNNLSRKTRGRRMAGTLVCLTAIEILTANAWLIAPVDTTEFTRGNLSIEDGLIESVHPELKPPAVAWPATIFRSRYDELEPTDWATTTSATRLEEVIRWQQESLYPKTHLQSNVVVMGSFSSIWPKDYQILLDQMEGFDDRQMAELGIQGVVRRGPNDGIQLEKLDAREMAYPALAWVGDNATVLRSSIKSTASQPVWSCEPVELSSNRMVFNVSTPTSGRLRFTRLLDRGWKAKVRPVVKQEVSELYQSPEWQAELSGGLSLRIEEPGDHELELVYSPTEFWCGLYLSLVAWGLVFLEAGLTLARSRPSAG